MTVPIMRQACAVLDALNEGQVIVVINTISYLFDTGYFDMDKREAVVDILKNACRSLKKILITDLTIKDGEIIYNVR